MLQYFCVALHLEIRRDMDTPQKCAWHAEMICQDMMQHVCVGGSLKFTYL